MPMNVWGTKNWQESANGVAVPKRKSKHQKIWRCFFCIFTSVNANFCRFLAIVEKQVRCNFHFLSFFAHISLLFFVYLYNYARITKYIKLPEVVMVNVKTDTLYVNNMLNMFCSGSLFRFFISLQKISKINVFWNITNNRRRTK